MKIAILSGKGGAGKTFIATNLARLIEGASYVDCDVEEPNGHIFLRSQTRIRERVTSPVPQVDLSKCNGCRTCLKVCNFKALAYIGGQVLVAPEQCHACGACGLFCPQEAITTRERSIGHMEIASYGTNRIFTGQLNIGEAKGLEIIQALLRKVESTKETVIIDCPPGTACNLIESIETVDYCLVVVEPTIFGLDNLKMVVELLRLLDKPFGLVINKQLEGEGDLLASYIKAESLKLLHSFPLSTRIGQLTGRGRLVVDQDLGLRQEFESLYEKLRGELDYEKIIGS